MINYIRLLRVIFGMIMASLVVSGMVFATYVMWKEENSCNKAIFLKGELSRDINRVDYMANGMVARIHYCDGTTEDVPTSRIVKVVAK